MVALKVNRSMVLRRSAGQYLVLSLIGLLFVFPIVFMVVSSFKPDIELLRDTSSMRAFLPVGTLSFNNYSSAFNRVPIARFMFNSIFVTALTVLIGMIINSMAAFSFAILKWRYKEAIMAVIIATFIIPFETVAIPLLLLINKLPWIGVNGFTVGWMNTYHVQIIPFLAYSFQIFLFYQFFREIPKDFVEAARIDGAGWFLIYRKLVLPISGPVIATAAILRFLDMWNQFLWPKMVVQSEEFRPVMVGLQYFFQLNIAWGEVMAYLTIITLPVLLFYLSLQRVFIESIASTGIKG